MTEVRSETARDDGIVDQAQERVHEAASTAQEKAVELKEQGSSKLREQLDTRSTDAGRQTRSFATTLRETSGQLRTEGNTTAASVAEQVADRLENLGGYLEQKRGDEMMSDVEDFARRRPWAVAGIGMLVGLAAARFMKASSERRYADRRAFGLGPAGSTYGAPYGGTDSYVTPYAPAAYETAPKPRFTDRAADAPLTRGSFEDNGPGSFDETETFTDRKPFDDEA